MAAMTVPFRVTWPATLSKMILFGQAQSANLLADSLSTAIARSPTAYLRNRRKRLNMLFVAPNV